MTTEYILAAMLVTGVITFVLRVAPYAFVARVQNSAILDYLARSMPAGVMLILVIYTLATVDFQNASSWLPPIVGIATTAALHLWMRQTLISLIGGTAAFALVFTLLT